MLRPTERTLRTQRRVTPKTEQSKGSGFCPEAYHLFLSQTTLGGSRNEKQTLVLLCWNLEIICSSIVSTLTSQGSQQKEDNDLVPESLARREEEFRISLYRDGELLESV